MAPLAVTVTVPSKGSTVIILVRIALQSRAKGLADGHARIPVRRLHVDRLQRWIIGAQDPFPAGAEKSPHGLVNPRSGRRLEHIHQTGIGCGDPASGLPLLRRGFDLELAAAGGKRKQQELPASPSPTAAAAT